MAFDYAAAVRGGMSPSDIQSYLKLVPGTQVINAPTQMPTDGSMPQVPSFSQGTATMQAQPSGERSILQSLVQGVTQPFLKVASNANKLGALTRDIGSGIIKGQKPTEILDSINADPNADPNQPTDFGYYGQVKPMQTVGDAIGTGLQIGSFATGAGEVGAAAELPGAIQAADAAGNGLRGLGEFGMQAGKNALQYGKLATVPSAMYGLGDALTQHQDFTDTLSTALKDTIMGIGGAALLGGPAALIGGEAAQGLRGLKGQGVQGAASSVGDTLANGMKNLMTVSPREVAPNALQELDQKIADPRNVSAPIKDTASNVSSAIKTLQSANGAKDSKSFLNAYNTLAQGYNQDLLGILPGKGSRDYLDGVLKNSEYTPGEILSFMQNPIENKGGIYRTDAAQEEIGNAIGDVRNEYKGLLSAAPGKGTWGDVRNTAMQNVSDKSTLANATDQSIQVNNYLDKIEGNLYAHPEKYFENYKKGAPISQQILKPTALDQIRLDSFKDAWNQSDQLAKAAPAVVGDAAKTHLVDAVPDAKTALDYNQALLQTKTMLNMLHNTSVPKDYTARVLQRLLVWKGFAAGGPLGGLAASKAGEGLAELMANPNIGRLPKQLMFEAHQSGASKNLTESIIDSIRNAKDETAAKVAQQQAATAASPAVQKLETDYGIKPAELHQAAMAIKQGTPTQQAIAPLLERGMSKGTEATNFAIKTTNTIRDAIPVIKQIKDDPALIGTLLEKNYGLPKELAAKYQDEFAIAAKSKTDKPLNSILQRLKSDLQESYKPPQATVAPPAQEPPVEPTIPPVQQ